MIHQADQKRVNEKHKFVCTFYKQKQLLFMIILLLDPIFQNEVKVGYWSGLTIYYMIMKFIIIIIAQVIIFIK